MGGAVERVSLMFCIFLAPSCFCKRFASNSPFHEYAYIIRVIEKYYSDRTIAVK